MVERINFNPFTGKELDQSLIEKLDGIDGTEKDGQISEQEFNTAYLQGYFNDQDEETQIEDIKFNPFTGQQFNAEEIVLIDTNRDNKISFKELTEFINSTIGAQGPNRVAAGDVINNSDTLLNQVSTIAGENELDIGSNGKVKSEEQLGTLVSLLTTQYLRNYFSQNDVDDETKSLIQGWVNEYAVTFFETENKALKATNSLEQADIAKDFMDGADDLIAKNRATKATNDAIINNWNNTDSTSWDKIMNVTNLFIEDNELSEFEWNQLSNKLVPYILGILNKAMQGDISPEDANFMNQLSMLGDKNSYSKIVGMLAELAVLTDPDEISKKLTEINEEVVKFVKSCGSGKNNLEVQNKRNSVLQLILDTNKEKTLKKDMDAAITTFKSKVGYNSKKTEEKAFIDGYINSVSTEFLTEFYQNKPENTQTAFAAKLNEGWKEFSKSMNELKDMLQTCKLDDKFKDQPQNENELADTYNVIVSTLQEDYLGQYSSYDNDVLRNLEACISNTALLCLNQYVEKHPTGPWSAVELMNNIVSSVKFEVDKLISAVDKNKEMVSETETQYGDSYMNDVINEIGLSNLYFQGLTDDINSDQIFDYEWKKIIDKGANYLIGLLLNDSDEAMAQLTDILIKSGYNSNSKAQTYYTRAYNAVKGMKTAGTEEEYKRLFEIAKENMELCLDALGKTNGDRNKVAQSFVNSANDRNMRQAHEDLDEVFERAMTNLISSHSEVSADILKAFGQSVFEAFVKEYYPPQADKTITDIRNDFIEYFRNARDSYFSTQETINNEYGATKKSFYSGEPGYTTKEKDFYDRYNRLKRGEIGKSDFISAAGDFIIAQIYNGNSDIDFLKALNPNYKNTKEFQELLKVIDQFKVCYDSNKATELINKANELVAKMLKNYSAEQLVSAVDKSKPIEIDDNAKNTVIMNCDDLSSDYVNGAYRTSKFTSDWEDAKKDAEKMAREDIAKYAKTLKEYLKNELGTAYNEAEIDKIIKSATNDTIMQFWEKLEHKVRKSNYKVPTDFRGFRTVRPSNYSEIRCCYNVKALIDAFVENFNEAAKQLKTNKQNPEKATYDWEDALTDAGLSMEYGEKLAGTKNRYKHDEAVACAKSYLVRIKAAIKNSYSQNGGNIPSNALDSILNNAIMDLMKEPDKYLSSYGYDKGNWGFLSPNVTRYEVNVKSLFDDFKTKVDAGIDEYKQSHKQK